MWTETNTKQNSLTQYIGETSGVDNPSTVNDCNPSSPCQSTDNKIFRKCCNTEVRPYGEFDVNNLPTYAFITPTLCDDGHDCGDATVDAWASANIQPVLDSAAYQAGTTAVFIWYDEDHPTPNVQVAPTSHRGDITQSGIGSHAALLKTIEDMLGLPLMSQGQLPGATDLRSIVGI